MERGWYQLSLDVDGRKYEFSVDTERQLHDLIRNLIGDGADALISELSGGAPGREA
jgi:hypothetical protein